MLLTTLVGSLFLRKREVGVRIARPCNINSLTWVNAPERGRWETTPVARHSEALAPSEGGEFVPPRSQQGRPYVVARVARYRRGLFA